MRKFNLLRQEDEMGCAVACVASILGISYKQSLKLFGIEKADSPIFYCKDIANILNNSGLKYKYGKVTDKNKKYSFNKGSIIFIKRSNKYPVGHFVLRTKNYWMNPWINLPNKPINAGFQKKLPGDPQWIIFEQNNNI